MLCYCHCHFQSNASLSINISMAPLGVINSAGIVCLEPVFDGGLFARSEGQEDKFSGDWRVDGAQ